MHLSIRAVTVAASIILAARQRRKANRSRRTKSGPAGQDPAGPIPFVAETSRSARRIRAPCAPHMSGAGRIPKPSVAACTIMPPPSSRMTTCAKRCCVASARPACRPSRPTGCRPQNNPRSAPPSPRSQSPRCNACSSRRNSALLVQAGDGAAGRFGPRQSMPAFVISYAGNTFHARWMPFAVILAPETSLIWPAGQVPSSTMTRWPSLQIDDILFARHLLRFAGRRARPTAASRPAAEIEKTLMCEVVMAGTAVRFTCSRSSVRSGRH